MNNKITLQDLASNLAANKNIPRKTAEVFLRHLFDIIQEYAIQDGQVKIKGFGTFKVISVESRESINVNTGERVLIEGHEKLTFVPDTSLRDQVNKPFVDFCTVVLNPSTRLDDMEFIDENDEEFPSYNTEIQEATDNVKKQGDDAIQNTFESQDELEIEEESSEIVETQNLTQEANMSSSTDTEMKEAISEAQKGNKTIHSRTETPPEQQAIHHIEHQTISQMTIGSQYVGQQTIQQMVTNAVHKELDSHNKILVSKHLLFVAAFFVFILLLAAYFMGYHVGVHLVPNRISYEQRLGRQNIQKVLIKKFPVRQKDSLKNGQTINTTKKITTSTLPSSSAEVISVNSKVGKKEVTPSAEVSQPIQQLSKTEIEKFASQYKQIPGGTYWILGTKQTHIMSKGDNLYKLARKIYGDSKLADYIIFYNQFPDPDKVFLGSKVLLPELVRKE